MKQYVLTRSAYGPAWDLAANQRRLAITRAVTGRSLAAQTVPDWTWVVLLHPRDPLIDERRALFRAVAPDYIELLTSTAGPAKRSEAAYADYHAPWRQEIPADDTVLMTRLDDDDGLASDTLERYRAAAEGLDQRTALMLPKGVRVWRGRYSDVIHDRNAMHTLVTPPGDTACVYDYSHINVAGFAPVVRVDDRWGWLWVRHRDTLSGWRQADTPISGMVRGAFPVDWPALEAAWQ